MQKRLWPHIHARSISELQEETEQGRTRVAWETGGAEEDRKVEMDGNARIPRDDAGVGVVGVSVGVAVESVDDDRGVGGRERADDGRDRGEYDYDHYVDVGGGWMQGSPKRSGNTLQ